MIEERFEEIILQERARLESGEGTFLLARYNNEFSIKSIKIKSAEKDPVRIYKVDLAYRDIIVGIEPFLSIIKDTVEKDLKGTYEDFFDKVGVYPLHRELFLSYFKTGNASRNESLIFTELGYEKMRFMEELASAIKYAADIHPFLLIINRIQIATYGLLEILSYLEKKLEGMHFSVIMGFSNTIPAPAYTAHFWEEFLERLDDAGRIINIGNARQAPGITENIPSMKDFSKNKLTRLTNLLMFFDVNTSDYYVSRIDRIIHESPDTVSEMELINFYKLKALNFLYKNDAGNTIECLNYIKDRVMKLDASFILPYLYLSAQAYMYNDSLEAAEEVVSASLMDENIDDEWRFRFEMLYAIIKMGAWNNIFFFREEMGVSDRLLKEMEEHRFYNHLAYFHIFAYDNDISKMRDQVKKAPEHFRKGIALAEKLDNKNLIHLAYEKNIMQASTGGLNDVAIYYFSKEAEILRTGDDAGRGHINCGIGYNLSALGHYDEADYYYYKAFINYYKTGSTVDIAEVIYNQSMNRIAVGDYASAGNLLNIVLKIIRHLRLNRIRVCNISKLYGLLGLASIMEGNRFLCEQHLKRCGNFLSYYMNKDYQAVIDRHHDYANYDDEILIYYLASAILSDEIGNDEDAERYYHLAHRYYSLAKGNCYFCEKIYFEKRKAFEQRTGNEKSLNTLLQEEKKYEEELEQRRNIDLSGWLEKKAFEKTADESLLNDIIKRIDIETLIERDEYRRADRNTRRLKVFLEDWQNTINKEDINPELLLKNAMYRFKSYFSVDHCMYLRLQDDGTYAQIYNDTGAGLSDIRTGNIVRYLKVNQRGLAITKSSNDYEDYKDMLKPFGGDKICSFVMIPFISNNKIEHIFITYIEMRDGWFSRLNHFLLDYQDLDVFRMLFHEIVSAVQRIEGLWKIREMNRELYQAAVTDQLTQIRNRNGLTHFINEIYNGNRENFRGNGAIMFIDLDNFKSYNDYYGHESGDYVLKSFARIFEDVVGRSGVVARYGGDEFIILLNTDDKNVILDVVEEIYSQIDRADGFKKEMHGGLPEKTDGGEPENISCSIGIATSARDGRSMDIATMIRDADKILYEVKNSGKGTYRFFKK